MATDAVISIAAKIAEYLVAPVGRQFGYLVCYSCNVEDLRGEVDSLEVAELSVQGLVDDAERNGQVILPDVQRWLKRAGGITKESRTFLQDEDKLDKRCFKGLCPNLKVRHQRSREAKKNSAFIDKLKQERNFDRVSVPARPPGIGSTSNEDAVEVFGSRKLTSKEIMEALKDDQITMIGVYGIGGIGKTTLVKEVAKQAKDDYDLFDEVLMAVVSQNPNYKNIQGEIADMLGLKFNVETIPGRAQRLHAELKKEKRILVILDDVWARLELDLIGIPIRRNHKGCKILFTSRSLNVCNEMGTQKNISVGVLSESEALALFKKMVGDSVETTDLRPLAVEVAKECSGLPVAIVTVARALKDKDLSVWRDAVKRLRKSIPSEKVSSTLRLSYDFLGSEEKKTFFLLTCLFPEDCNIAIQDLMKYGIGLGLFQEVENLDDAIERSITLAYYLKSSCLLLDGSNQNRVKVHDVIRDVAISIASKGKPMFLVRAGPEWKEWPKKELFKRYTAISLMSQDILKLPDGLECPKLKLLLLKCSHPSLHFPNNFFSSMKKLEVLDMSGMRFSQLPQSLKCLKQLRTLRLDFCELEDISIIGELNNLEVLSFLGSNIEVLPKEVGKLSQLRLLDLTQCKFLKIIAPEAIQGLSKLEGLYMIESFKEWEVGRQEKERSNASLSDLQRLLQLIALEIYIPEPEFLPDDFVFGNLLRYRISIGTPIYSWAPTSYSKFLKLKVSVPLKDGVNILLKTAEHINLVYVKGLKYVLSDLDREGFLKLKCLEVYECDNVEFIVNTGKWISDVAFPVLEKLDLYNLAALKEICHGQLPRGFFSELQVLELQDLPGLIGLWKDPAQHVNLCNLRVLKVIDCNRLKSIFPSSTAKNLSKLRKLKVSGCKVMETIFECEGEEASTLRVDILLPHLRSLKLENLPSLTCFLSNTESLASNRICEASIKQPLFSKKVSFPELEKLHLSGLKNLRLIWPSHFPIEDICVPATLTQLRELKLRKLPKLMHLFNENSHQTYSLSNLCSLDIYKCGSLKHVFSTSIAIGLSQLQRLNVDSCAMMKEIMANDNEGKEEAPGKILFPQVDTLQLRNLQELMSFSMGSYTAEFPSLISLEIKYCPKIQALLSSVRPSSLKLDISIEELEYLEGNLGIPTQALFNEKVVFPTLEKLMINNAAEYEGPVVMDGEAREMLSQLKGLELSALPKLRSIWPSKNPEKVSFSALEVLNLYKLDNLGELWHPQIPASSFPRLKVIQVRACHELLSVVPPNILVGLKNLEELTIKECKLVEKIFELDRFVFAEEHAEVVLPKLKKLILRSLPKLEKIWSDTHPHQLPGFQNLSFLEIYECHGLKSLVTTSSACFLEKLEEVNIYSCKIMEAIVTKGIIDQNPLEAITFPRVHTLKLRNLPELKSFYKGNCAFKWPALACLWIVRCPKMSPFAYRSLSSSPKVNTQDEVLEAPDDVPIEPLFHGQVIVTVLKELQIEGLENLKQIWKDHFPSQFEESSVKQGHLTGSFSHLKTLELRYLPKLMKVGWDTMQHSLQEKIIFSSLDILKLYGLDSLEKIWSPEVPAESYPKLRILEVESCNKLSTVIPFNMLKNLQNLDKLTVRKCDSVEKVFELQEFVEEGHVSLALPKLSRLNLWSLPNLRGSLWDNSQHQILDFPKLRWLNVNNCQNLSSLFTPSAAHHLVQLKEAVIDSCEKMEAIVSMVSRDENPMEVVELPRLRTLQLTHLPKLKSFNRGSCALKWPTLRSLWIADCPQMQAFTSEFHSNPSKTNMDDEGSHEIAEENITPVQAPFDKQVAFPFLEVLQLSGLDSERWLAELLAKSFPKLRVLKLLGLPKSLTSGPSNMLPELQNLEELSVGDCESIEKVFEFEGLVEEGHATTTPPISIKLNLQNLPNLCEIWGLRKSPNQYLVFPMLTTLNVSKCNNLRNLFTKSTVCCLLQLQELEIDSCEIIKTVIADDSGGGNLTEVFEFTQMQTLKLDNLPGLESFSTGTCSLKFPTLKCLEIRRCPEMKTFTYRSLYPRNPHTLDDGFEEMPEQSSHCIPKQTLFDKQTSFNSLEELCLDGLKNVKEIWHRQLPAESFGRLRDLKVERCNNIVKVVPCNLLPGLQNLKSFSLSECAMVEEVFEFVGIHVGEGHPSLSLFKLKKLKLCKLPKLMQMCWNKKLRGIVGFPNLHELHIIKCDALKNIFFHSVAKSFVNLQSLYVNDCLIMEEIVVSEEKGEDARGKSVFPLLKRLELKDLPNLQSFCSGSYTFNWPQLNIVMLHNCPEMQKFSLGIVCTPMLNTICIGNKNMWKGDLNSTVQHLFEVKQDEPKDEGSSGGEEKQEDEQRTKSSKNEVSGEEEKNTANTNISGVANEGEVLQGPIEQHQEKGEGEGVIPLSNANQDNTDSKPSPEQLESSENLRSQDDGPTPTTSKYPTSSQLIPQNVTEISASQSPPQQHLPLNTPTSSQSIPDNVTQTPASISPQLHLSLNTPTSSQSSPDNVTQTPASQSPQLHLSMNTPKQVDNCTPIVSALLTSHSPIPKTSSIPESGSSRTSAEQESITPLGILSPSRRLSHKLSQPEVAIPYESSLVEDQPNLLDTHDVKLSCGDWDQAYSQSNPPSIGETSSQRVVPSCFVPEISSHPFSDLVLKGLFKDFSSVTLPTRLKEKVTTASDPPPVEAPNDEWCEVQLRYPWFTSVLAQFPQHSQIVTFYELVASSRVLLMLRSLSLDRLHLLEKCFHKYEDFGFNCEPFLSIVSSAIQIKQAEQSLIKLNHSLDDQRHNHKERVEFLELSQSLRTEIHELEEKKHRLKQELAHVTAELGSREQILHELDISYQKMGDGEIVLAETEEDMRKTEEAIAIYSLQLQTAKTTLENAGF